ncbi:MAG TPA: cyclic nucleotide-binding domain-containing protein, partial [Spirochaetota bacterium]|nr:cyclic nucleotide-binding domain-containing protein [Spirochaetota bacterium]
MGIETGKTGSITVSDGEVIISQGQTVKSLYILTSGKIEIVKTASGLDISTDDEVLLTEGYRLGQLGQNTFPGIPNLFDGKPASCSYRALGPCSLYIAPIQNEQQLQSIMASKPDHAMAMAMTMMLGIDALSQFWTRLQRGHDTLSIMVENAGVYYFLLKEIIGSKSTVHSSYFRQAEQNLAALRLRDIPVPEEFSQPFMEKDFSAIYGEERLSPPQNNKKQVEYYRRFARLAPNLRKAFFTADPAMTLYICHDLSRCFGQLMDDVGSLVDRYDELFDTIYNLHKESLFTEFARAAIDAIRTNSDSVLPSQIIDYLSIRTKELLSGFASEFGKDPGIDFGYFERALQQDDINAVAEGVETSGLSPDIAALLDDDAGVDDSADVAIIPDETPTVEEIVDVSSLPDELKGSLKKILDYSAISKEKADQFKAAMDSFRKLKDKFSSEDPVRKLRRAVTTIFYDVYEAVFKRMHKERNTSRLYTMFINYGYMDERLLNPATTMRLYKLQDPSRLNPEFPVYSMTEWLSTIYSREKEPSIDDFGNDYMGVFRELKKRGEVGEADKESYENNVEKRLHHEIAHMVKTTQRLCYGQLSVHFPVLHEDMFVKEMENALVLKKKVEDELRKLLKIDFSAFYREVMLRKPDAGIEREFIQMPVIPDIILAPTFGSRQFMWQ